MAAIEFPEIFSQWANVVLVWIGFGTVVGLVAKAIMPGRDPGGALTTLLIGIGGSIIGSGTLLLFNDHLRVSPVSPLGFVVATAGAFFLLLFYRLLAGRIFREGGYDLPRLYQRSRGHRRVSVVEED